MQWRRHAWHGVGGPWGMRQQRARLRGGGATCPCEMHVLARALAHACIEMCFSRSHAVECMRRSLSDQVTPGGRLCRSLGVAIRGRRGRAGAVVERRRGRRRVRLADRAGEYATAVSATGGRQVMSSWDCASDASEVGMRAKPLRLGEAHPPASTSPLKQLSGHVCWRVGWRGRR